jgi:hypothetical protein
MQQPARATLATRPRWAAHLAFGGLIVALLMLASFYAVVAAAVDRGERRVFAADQSDIDEDLRTPPGKVLVVRAAPTR